MSVSSILVEDPTTAGYTIRCGASWATRHSRSEILCLTYNSGWLNRENSWGIIPIRNTKYIGHYLFTKRKLYVWFILRIWFIQARSKIYGLPFHGVVGVLANPDSRMLRNSHACFTNSLRSRSVAMTLPSSLLSSDLACVKWKQYVNFSTKFIFIKFRTSINPNSVKLKMSKWPWPLVHWPCHSAVGRWSRLWPTVGSSGTRGGRFPSRWPADSRCTPR